LYVVLTFAIGYLHQAIFLHPICVPEKVGVYYKNINQNMKFPYKMMELVGVSARECSQPKGVMLKRTGCKLGSVVHWQRC